VLAAVLLLALLSAASAPAQFISTSATQPGATSVARAADTDLERLEIGKSPAGSAAANASTTSTNRAQASRSIPVDLARMAIALTIVLGLIFGARWLVLHFFVGTRAPATSRAVKVLGRTSLAPRQQVLLLQIGRRVVVVGESNGQLATLAQLEDPDEVASLLGQLQEEQVQRPSSFGGVFGKVQRKFSGEEDEHAPRPLTDLEDQASEPSLEPANDSQARSELAGLVDKVRSIRDQLGR
jgi:flagellar protein FliO/FliZ